MKPRLFQRKPTAATERTSNHKRYPGKVGTGRADAATTAALAAAAVGVNSTGAESVLAPLALTALSRALTKTPLVRPVTTIGLEISAGASAT